MVYILIAILIFGVLIAVHEFGHFLAAKACGVRVNEFSIGMGPQLFHKTKGDTEYSLRLLPIGGYCAMEGEDEDSDDDRALGRQVWWKKFIIFVAGAFMNFLTGLIIVICLYAGAQAFYTTEIVELNPDFPQQGEDGLALRVPEAGVVLHHLGAAGCEHQTEVKDPLEGAALGAQRSHGG